MDYIKIEGDKNTVIRELTKYMDQEGTQFMIQNQQFLNNILDEDDAFDYKIEAVGHTEGLLAFTIPKTNYYINMKKTTLAFIGLLFDIHFTKGFASFVLNIFGITADTIRKLSNIEKCILIMIKSGSIIIDNDEYAFAGTPNCMNYATECTYCQYNRCSLSKEVLNDTILKLLEKDIIRRNGNLLISCF